MPDFIDKLAAVFFSFAIYVSNPTETCGKPKRKASSHSFSNASNVRGDFYLPRAFLLSAVREVGHTPTVPQLERIISVCVPSNAYNSVEPPITFEIFARICAILSETESLGVPNDLGMGKSNVSVAFLRKFLENSQVLLTPGEVEAIILLLDPRGTGKISLEKLRKQLDYSSEKQPLMCMGEEGRLQKQRRHDRSNNNNCGSAAVPVDEGKYPLESTHRTPAKKDRTNQLKTDRASTHDLQNHIPSAQTQNPGENDGQKQHHHKSGGPVKEKARHKGGHLISRKTLEITRHSGFSSPSSEDGSSNAFPSDLSDGMLSDINRRSATHRTSADAQRSASKQSRKGHSSEGSAEPSRSDADVEEAGSGNKLRAAYRTCCDKLLNARDRALERDDCDCCCGCGGNSCVIC